MDEKVVYPNRVGVWFALVFFAVFGAGCAAIGVDELAADATSDDLLYGAGAVFFAAGSRAAVRQLRRPKPFVRLDRDGIEGDFGRIAWRDVTDVRVRWRWEGRYAARKLVLRLRLRRGADPAPARGDYVSTWFDEVDVEDDAVELALWGRRRTVLADVRRFHPGVTE